MRSWHALTGLSGGTLAVLQLRFLGTSAALQWGDKLGIPNYGFRV